MGVKHEECRSADPTPLLAEEGWPRRSRRIAKPPLMERTGWCSGSRNVFEPDTTPSRSRF